MKDIAKWPKITQLHREAVERVLDSGTLVDGNEVESLEEEFGSYVNAKHCVTLSNGTSAIYAALLALGISEGDEVIVPSLTFSGTALPVLQVGAFPRFCDVDKQTFLIDPKKIAESINKRTRAIIVVHLHGLTADVAAIKASIPAGIAIIEDTCQAPGAMLPTGERAGTVGTVGVYSLNQSKPLWAGEGGLLVTQEMEIAAEVRRIKRYGENLDSGGRRSYVVERMGANLRMPELSAALGRVSLTELAGVNARARSAGQYLSNRLKEVRHCLTPFVPTGADHTYHKYRLVVDTEIAKNALLASDAPVATWQHLALPLHPQFHSSDPLISANAQWVLDHSVVVGLESAPLGEQRFETIQEWADKISSVLA